LNLLSIGFPKTLDSLSISLEVEIRRPFPILLAGYAYYAGFHVYTGSKAFEKCLGTYVAKEIEKLRVTPSDLVYAKSSIEFFSSRSRTA